VVWYGGEPTLALEQITTLTQKLLRQCEDANIEYGASMVSNGYLLDAQVARRLRELGVTRVQITVDGPLGAS